MPPNRYRLPLLYRRRQLANSIKAPIPAIRVCRNYLKANRPEKYKVSGSSDRCVEYARLGYACDLAPFSPAKWARIEQQRILKAAEAKEALARFTRLQAEVEVLEKRKLEMVEGELRNIEELEQEE